MLRRVPEERILIPDILSHPWLASERDELTSTLCRDECVKMSGCDTGLEADSSMATHANINFINMENIFQHSCVSSLQYDDFTSLAEDFATMHINEDALDTLDNRHAFALLTSTPTLSQDLLCLRASLAHQLG